MNEISSWNEEKRAAYLYRVVAACEAGTPREKLFLGLAREAEGQALIWAEKALAAGATLPVFAPDGSTIAFTGEYDGNTDVFTIPAAGGIPHRVTYHPAPDAAVAWTPDGKRILFRSTRAAASRYTQIFSVPAEGGIMF